MVELRDYQKFMVQTIAERKNVLMVAPMGAGKTLASLTALVQLIYRGDVKSILIVAPKRVAMSVWVQEARDYDIPVNIRFCRLALDIKMFLSEPADHHICVCSVTRIDEIPHGCWDMVVLDESTLFGNKSSNRSAEVRRICKKVPRRLLLTGTPVHRGYEKLWHQIFLLDAGAALGKTLTMFRALYMRVKYMISGVTTVYEMDMNKCGVLMQNIAHLICVVRDAVTLPPVLFKIIFIDLPLGRRKEYDLFEKESILTFKEETGGDPLASSKTLIAFAASSRGIKLRQLASGCVYADETNQTYSVTHRGKIEALQELRESYESNILVAYLFRSEYDELNKAFPAARRLDTAEDIEDWQAGKIGMALVHPQSVGHGLNLQKGGSVVVWFSLTYDCELYAQLNKRLHRSGQTETVSIVHLIARNTIDQKILWVLRERESAAEEFNKSF